MDRTLANHTQKVQFTTAKVHHLPFFHSDHAPILVDLNPFVQPNYHHKIHHFEKWQLNHDDYDRVAGEFINDHLGNIEAGVTPQHLANFMCSLHRWSSNHFGHLNRRIKGLYNDYSHALSIGDRSKKNEFKTKIFQTLKDQETFWMQRSHIQWINEGDKKYLLFP